MTIQLGIIIFTIEAIVASLITEAIKKTYQNAGATYSANLIALIDSLVVGGCGTATIYALYGIPFTLTNSLVLGIMILAVWLGATLGYDKVIQTIEQIKKVI